MKCLAPEGQARLCSGLGRREPMFSVRLEGMAMLRAGVRRPCSACGEDTAKPVDGDGDTLPVGRTFLLAARAEAYDAAALRPWTASLADARRHDLRRSAMATWRRCRRYARSRRWSSRSIRSVSHGVRSAGRTTARSRCRPPWLAEVESMDGLAAEAGLAGRLGALRRCRPSTTRSPPTRVTKVASSS